MWLFGARVAAACAPLDDAAFADLVATGHDAVAREALGRFDRVAGQIRRRLRCSEPPPAEPWATHLVDLAVVAYFRDADWQTPLATALWTTPDIDRGVGADHEIAGWDPGPPPAVPLAADDVLEGPPVRSSLDVALIGVLRSTPEAVSLGLGGDLAARVGARFGAELEVAATPRWLDGAARVELRAGPVALGVGPALLATGTGWWMVGPGGALRVSLTDDVVLALAAAATPESRWLTARFAVSRPAGERLAWQVGALARVSGGTAPEATIGARVGLVLGR